jgi:hypothetical protein
MAGSTFQTNPYDLLRLLEECHLGTIQLPDFQRSWVWDEDHQEPDCFDLASFSCRSLNTGGPINFKPRPIEGAPVDVPKLSETPWTAPVFPVCHDRELKTNQN